MTSIERRVESFNKNYGTKFSVARDEKYGGYILYLDGDIHCRHLNRPSVSSMMELYAISHLDIKPFTFNY